MGLYGVQGESGYGLSDMKRLLEIVLLIAAVALMYSTAARGDDVTAINLARCLRAETNTYSKDWPVMAWVLKKRAMRKGITLNEMVLQYCAVFDRRSYAYYRARSAKIRTSTFQDPKYGTAKEWRALARFVAAFLKGRVADPCPEAEHFGNEGDVGAKSLVEVCPELGKRGNKFYKVVR